MKITKTALLLISTLSIAACTTKPGEKTVATADQRLVHIADDLVAQSEVKFVTSSLLRGVPGSNHRMFDNSSAARVAWRTTVDKWDSLLEEINPEELSQNNVGLYSLLRQQLSTETSVRVCDGLNELSHRSGSWHRTFLKILKRLPLKTAKDKENMFVRHSKLPVFVDNEIEKLSTYLSEGKTSPRFIVENVIEQLESYTKHPASQSAFVKTIRKVDDIEFLEKWEDMVESVIIPSFKKYQNFLTDVYLPKARKSISLSKAPGGDQCYLAKIAQNTTLNITPEEIDVLGSAFEKEMLEKFSNLSLKHFNTTDRKEYRKLQKGPKYKFSSREEMEEYAREYLDKSKVLAKKVFTKIPEGEIIVERMPKETEKHQANGSYVRGDPLQNKPAKFMLNTYKAKKKTKSSLGRLVLHEAIPGHHMLALTTMSNENLHPAAHMMRLRVFSEGWSIYGEILASEEGLFLSELDELAFYSSKTYSYFRTKVEMNIHLKGWDLETAIARMMEEGYSRENAEIVVGRLVVYPGGTMPYLVGSLEIRRLREYAKQKLGEGFDIKDFHDLVLSGGSLPLNALKSKVEHWVDGGAR